MHSGHLNLIVGTHSTYADTDILSACNHLTIRRMACWRSVAPRGEGTSGRMWAGRNASGFLSHDHLIKDHEEATREFRIERVNKDQHKIIRLSDMDEILVTSGVEFTDHRGKTGRVSHTAQMFANRLRPFQKDSAQGCPFFSDDGDENKVVFYAGRTTNTDAAQDAIWTAANTKAGIIEDDETAYDKEPPFGRFRKNRLVIAVDDFTDAERGLLTVDQSEEDDVTVSNSVPITDPDQRAENGVLAGEFLCECQIDETIPTRLTGGTLTQDNHTFEVTSQTAERLFVKNRDDATSPVSGPVKLTVTLSKRRNQVDYLTNLGLTSGELSGIAGGSEVNVRHTEHLRSAKVDGKVR